MYIYTPSNPNGLLVVCDFRLKSDVLIQEGHGGLPVLEEHKFFQAALGRSNWERTARIALFNYKEEPPRGEDLRKVRAEFADTVHKLQPRAILVLQTLATGAQDDDEDSPESGGTLVWDSFKSPESFAEMAGCAWDTCPPFPGVYVVALPNPANYEFVYGWLIKRWMRMGLALAEGRLSPLEPERKILHAGQEADEALSAMLGKSVAVDIEAVSKFDLITDIGVSDGKVSVSLPWDEYTIYGTGETVYGAKNTLSGRLMVNVLQASTQKILQNHSFDQPFLAKHGIQLNGFIHDTMAMHKAVPPYSQYKRGLQRAASQMFCVRPWKSLWHPKVPGKTKKDAEYWTAGPPESRRLYNCDDTHKTYWIGDHLSWQVGVKL